MKLMCNYKIHLYTRDCCVEVAARRCRGAKMALKGNRTNPRRRARLVAAPRQGD